MHVLTNANVHPTRGFTIVELLIVTVVISILAAISVIAYQGVTARSENTKTINSVSAYARAMVAYFQENGVYPGTAGGWHCLPDSDNVCLSSSNTPSSCFFLNTTNYNNSLDNDLKTIVTYLPKASDQSMDCSATQTFNGGVIHVTATKKSSLIYFGLRGDVACPTISGTSNPQKNFSVSTTRCEVTLPTL